MILKHRNTVSLRIEGNRITLAGRRYESAHVIITGASALHMLIAPDHVVLDAMFSDLPEIHDSTPHILRVSAPGSTLELDVEGTQIKDIREDDDSITINADILTFKFEASEGDERVVIKLPRLGPLKASSARVEFSSPSYVNTIIEPFIIGIVSAKPRDDVIIRFDKEKSQIVIKG
jgi:hypothetical protein